MTTPPAPRFAVVANPDSSSPQELVSFATVDQALSALTHARRGKWPSAQVVQVEGQVKGRRPP